MKGLLVALMLVILPWPLFAYNFLYINPQSGKPVIWDNTKTIQYWVDPGSFGRLTNSQAVTLLQSAMKIWENASPNANVPLFQFMGFLPEDVNGTNYQKYVTNQPCYTEAGFESTGPTTGLAGCTTGPQQNLQTVIIFDDDGSILSNGFCAITPCGAFSGASVFSGTEANPQSIIQGYSILGPKLVLAGVPLATIIPTTVGTMVHELGHLLGLAHPSLNEEVYLQDEIPNSQYLPTMFFESLPGVFSAGDRGKITLHPDDIAAISTLYPTASFSQSTATITGQVLKSDNTPMMYVNVVARNTEDPLCEAYSMLSGRFCQTTDFIDEICSSANGTFTISGLPAGSYTMEVEDVDDYLLALTLAPGLFNPVLDGDAGFLDSNNQTTESYQLASVITLAGGQTQDNVNIILDNNTVTPDSIKYVPLSTFTPGSATGCQPSTTDYASMIGVAAAPAPSTATSNSTPTAGGCSLIRQ